MSKRTKNHDVDKRVGANLKALRLKAGFSQAELAAKVGLTFQQIQKYEKGKNRLSASTICFMCRALDAEIMQFFSGLEPKTRSVSLFSKDQIEIMSLYAQLPSDFVRRQFKELMKSLITKA